VTPEFGVWCALELSTHALFPTSHSPGQGTAKRGAVEMQTTRSISAFSMATVGLFGRYTDTGEAKA